MDGLNRMSKEEVRELDRWAIEELGVPGVVLMENAGRGAADWILARLDQLGVGPGDRVGVLCGKGNNGGDGYVVARHLMLGGVDVCIGELVRQAETGSDSEVFRAVCVKMGIPVVELISPDDVRGMGTVQLWVDGMLGTGFSAPLSVALADILGGVSEARETVGATLVALDCPSGMDVDSGDMATGGLRADHTLTFGAMKVGFRGASAVSALGPISVLSLGVPVEFG